MFGKSTSAARIAWFDDLNPQQRQVASHDGGPLLVIAGAGTGKTAAVVGRLARLLGSGADPERVLLLTFSRRAAREMLARAGHLIGHEKTRPVWGGTFHAMAHRLLRTYGAAVGLDPGFTILDDGDTVELMGAARADLGFGERGRRFPKKETLVEIMSRVANAQEPLTQVVAERFAWCRVEPDELRELFEAYRDRKVARNLVDFDDLLLYWRALTASPVGEMLRARFEHVLVDEYQDTNVLQADILSGMTPDGRGLCAVGDDAQAIYGFRAASAGNMTTFGDRFPGALTIRLEQNYRSTAPIIAVANAVITESTTALRKELWTDRSGGLRPRIVTCGDESDEAEAIADAVLAAYEEGLPLREQAVLCRAAHHTARLELELTQRNIRYRKYGGIRFLEAAHVKDLLGLLRVLENPSDDLAWRRCLLMLDGIGPGLTRRVLEALELPNPHARARLADLDLGLPPVAAASIDSLLAAWDDCDVEPEPAPGAQVDRLTEFCRPLIEQRFPDAPARLADLEQLGAMAGEHSSRAAFLGELVLDPPSATSDYAGDPEIDDDYLVLSTVHSAKGLEWTNVYVLHATDGNFPSDLALKQPDGLEEERRLFYVAVTRARDVLTITYPLRYYRFPSRLGDLHVYGTPSRFLLALTALCESTAQGHAPDDGAVLVAADRRTDRVGSQLSSLWST